MRTIRSDTIFCKRKPFKNDEKCFLFYLKTSFCAQEIKIFVLTFWSCRKAALLQTLPCYFMCRAVAQQQADD